MKDILGKEIVSYNEACYLREVGFDGECTGYYHTGECYDEWLDENRYECVGCRGLYRNSFSVYRVAAPSIRAARLWYTRNNVKPFISKAS